jgi:hypothetical protein
MAQSINDGSPRGARPRAGRQDLVRGVGYGLEADELITGSAAITSNFQRTLRSSIHRNVEGDDHHIAAATREGVKTRRTQRSGRERENVSARLARIVHFELDSNRNPALPLERDGHHGVRFETRHDKGPERVFELTPAARYGNSLIAVGGNRRQGVAEDLDRRSRGMRERSASPLASPPRLPLESNHLETLPRAFESDGPRTPRGRRLGPASPPHSRLENSYRWPTWCQGGGSCICSFPACSRPPPARDQQAWCHGKRIPSGTRSSGARSPGSPASSEPRPLLRGGRCGRRWCDRPPDPRGLHSRRART